MTFDALTQGLLASETFHWRDVWERYDANDNGTLDQTEFLRFYVEILAPVISSAPTPTGKASPSATLATLATRSDESPEPSSRGRQEEERRLRTQLEAKQQASMASHREREAQKRKMIRIEVEAARRDQERLLLEEAQQAEARQIATAMRRKKQKDLKEEARRRHHEKVDAAAEEGRTQHSACVKTKRKAQEEEEKARDPGRFSDSGPERQKVPPRHYEPGDEPDDESDDKSDTQHTLEELKSRHESKSKQREEEAHRRMRRSSGLMRVFEAFDYDRSGYVCSKELYALGMARRAKGHKTSSWTADKNAKLIQQMDRDGDGVIQKEECVMHFDACLPSDEMSFNAVLDEFMEAAMHIRDTKDEAKSSPTMLVNARVPRGELPEEDTVKAQGSALETEGVREALVQAATAQREAQVQSSSPVASAGPDVASIDREREQDRRDEAAFVEGDLH